MDYRSQRNRVTSSQLMPRDSRQRATERCYDYSSTSEFSYRCLDCKFLKRHNFVRELCFFIFFLLIALVLISGFADAQYREAQNAKSLSDAYEHQYQMSRVGDLSAQ